MKLKEYINQVILNLIQDLQRLSLLNSMRGRSRIKYGMTALLTTAGGFTLIELLVVVLIIGILAAVAVPQYQKAVVKSRLSKMITSARSLYEAQEYFRLNNGKLAIYLSNLDIDFSGSAVTGFSNYERCRSKGGAVWKRSVADGVVDMGDYEVGIAGPYYNTGASAAALKDKCLFILFLHAPDAHAGEALCYDAGDDIDLCSKYFKLGASAGGGGSYGALSRDSHVISN